MWVAVGYVEGELPHGSLRLEIAVTDQDPAMEQARKRAAELKDFYKHLIIYVLVCSLLVVIDVADNNPASDTFIGLQWAYWPIFGWGIAVVIHAISTFVPMRDWEERKARQLYEKEQRRQLGQH
jgi:hypothetical protein